MGTQYGRKTINLSHSHTAPAHTHTTGNHTLTVAEMPSHNHTTPSRYIYCAKGDSDFWHVPYSSGDKGNMGVSYNGGNQGHNHGNTGSAGNSATTSSLNSDIDITPLSVAAYCWKRTE